MDDSRTVFIYTRTAKVCVDQIVTHLQRIDIEPRPVIAEILDEFEARVERFPLGCQQCPELVKLGCAKYRECNTSGGYRVLYSIDEETINVHAVLSHRQDIQQLLFKRLIQA